MQSFGDLLEQSNQAGMGFLLTELETALTFLSVAETTRNKESAVRNRNNALTAYESVIHYQGRIRFDADERIAFNDKFGQVKRALLAIGFAV